MSKKNRQNKQVETANLQESQIETAPAEISSDVQNETSNTNNATERSEGESKKMEPIKLKVTQTVTSLDTMEDVRLIKLVPFENPTTIQEAEQRLGNDTKKLLEIIVRGMQADAKDAAKDDMSGWSTINAKGAPDVLFSGEMVDPDKVGGLIREMSKIGGYTDNKGNPEKRQAIRKKATDMVKAMIQGNAELKASVALSKTSDVVTEGDEEIDVTEGEETPVTA